MVNKTCKADSWSKGMHCCVFVIVAQEEICCSISPAQVFVWRCENYLWVGWGWAALIPILLHLPSLTSVPQTLPLWAAWSWAREECFSHIILWFQIYLSSTPARTLWSRLGGWYWGGVGKTKSHGCNASITISLDWPTYSLHAFRESFEKSFFQPLSSLFCEKGIYCGWHNAQTQCNCGGTNDIWPKQNYTQKSYAS